MPFINDQVTNANQLVNLGIAKRIHSFVQNTNEIYETVMEVAASSVMKEKAIEMKKFENRLLLAIVFGIVAGTLCAVLDLIPGDAFCKVLIAAINDGRYETSWTFAARLVE